MKFNLLVLTTLLLGACSSSKSSPEHANSLIDIPSDNSKILSVSDDEKKLDAQMKELVAKMTNLAGNQNVQDRSRWSVSGDGKQVTFNGYFEPGDCDLLKIILKKEGSKAQEFVVNSAGGATREGFCLARELRKRNIRKVVVSGICLGACANTIFLSASVKEIKRGVVGFNGNMTTLIQQSGGFEAMLSMVPDQNPSGKPGGSFRDRAKADGVVLIKEEKKFLKETGVSQKLFDLASPNDKNQFDYLLPTSATFSKFGVKGVIGEQDLFLNKYLGLKNQVY